MSTIRLRGMTWDHPRGFDPLDKGAPGFAAAHPGIEVSWTRRSLRDFGVQPVEDLARNFDLIVVDHPFCGRAEATGCLLNLEPLLGEAFLAMLEKQSVGPSTRSYRFGRGVWALPTDSAAQVASYRPDLLASLGREGPPRTFGDILQLGRDARRRGLFLAMPACQSDAACLVATMSANMGTPIRPDTPFLLPEDVFEAVLDRLREILALAHPASTGWNPIKTYDAMSTGDDIVYVPFAFGYSNYSRLGVAKPIRFTTIAGPGPDPAAGAILGGAGCAISSSCANVEAAVAYLRHVHTPGHQAGDYFAFGGQPGLRAAWTSAEVDRQAGGFFSGTLETLDKAWLRPRFDGFIHAFEHMGDLVHRFLAGDGKASSVIQDANDTYARAVERASLKRADPSP
jgi:multiple sugar transport system substrate-binding protein